MSLAREANIDDAAELIESAGLEEPDVASADSTNMRDAIRVVKGNPTDEDIAALVAVLTAAAASTSAAPDPRPAELWGAPTTMHRTYAPFSPYSFAASRRY